MKHDPIKVMLVSDILIDFLESMRDVDITQSDLQGISMAKAMDIIALFSQRCEVCGKAYTAESSPRIKSICNHCRDF